MNYMKKALLVAVSVICLVQFPVVTVANEVQLAQIQDEDFEKSENYVEMEGIQNEVGLSMSLFADSSIDFAELEMDDVLANTSETRSTAKSDSNLSLTRKFAQKKVWS